MSPDGPLIEVQLAYGKSGMTVSVPASAAVLVPAYHDAAPNLDDELARALAAPVAGPRLRDLVRPGQRVAVAICDGTRPQPRAAMLRSLLVELDGNVDPEDLTVFVATGTHEPPDTDQFAALVGPDLAERVRVVGHDARDDASLLDLGVHGSGVPVLCNRAFLAAEVRVTTGFVEPHFFAGFSGGPKLVAPGLLGLASVLVLHDAERIGSPMASFGRLEGNPVHDDIRAIARAIRVDFGFDVVLNREQQVVRAFAGELFAMHADAVALVKKTAMVAVPEPFDVVVTTNAGSPLDQNLYQSVKGIAAAAQVVRPGGLIIIAAECREGFPDFGEFRALLTSAPDLATLNDVVLRCPTTPDQWQVQVLARALGRARVQLACDGLSDVDVRAAHLEPIGDVTASLVGELARRGPHATCCVLPEGPLTIPYVAEETTKPTTGGYAR